MHSQRRPSGFPCILGVGYERRVEKGPKVLASAAGNKIVKLAEMGNVGSMDLGALGV
jgi:hypothetical protein